MTVYLNGTFIPDTQASVPVSDRGFLYGDALFETVRAYDGRLFLWDAHMDRLLEGADALRLRLPETPEQLRTAAAELLRRNQLPDAVLRLTVSRGSGPRGYSIRGALTPTVVITSHPAPPLNDALPPALRLHTARHRLPAGDPIARFKTASKLLHVLARAEAEEAGGDEALLLNTDGHLTETSAANLFWIRDNTLLTPHLAAGGLAGVTRAFVIDLIRAAGWPFHETLEPPAALLNASGAFLTVSTLGVVPVASIDNCPIPSHPRIPALHHAYLDAVRRELRSEPGICH